MTISYVNLELSRFGSDELALLHGELAKGNGKCHRCKTTMLAGNNYGLIGEPINNKRFKEVKVWVLCGNCFKEIERVVRNEGDKQVSGLPAPVNG